MRNQDSVRRGPLGRVCEIPSVQTQFVQCRKQTTLALASVSRLVFPSADKQQKAETSKDRGGSRKLEPSVLFAGVKTNFEREPTG